MIVLGYSGYVAKQIWAFKGNVSGWIVENESIYGAYGEAKYFRFELDSQSVSTFDSLLELNNHLKANGLQNYLLDREENVYHLLYGNGRYREY